MQLVCKESRRSFLWYYDTTDKLYIRKNEKDQENARITGKNLPNPMDIFQARTKAISIGQLPLGARTQADPITKKLWEHYNA